MKYSVIRACFKCLAIYTYLLIIVLDINARVSVPSCLEAKINMANAVKGVSVFGHKFPPSRSAAKFIAYS